MMVTRRITILALIAIKFTPTTTTTPTSSATTASNNMVEYSEPVYGNEDDDMRSPLMDNPPPTSSPSSSPENNSNALGELQDASDDPVPIMDGIADEEEDRETPTVLVTANETESNTFQQDRMVGAGVASGVVGMLVGGPLIGLVLGFGTARCTCVDGAAGDVARAIGDVALVTKSKAVQLEAKHHLVAKAKVATRDAWERAKEIDQNHHVLENTKNFVVFSWQQFLRINREHRVVERSIEAIGRALGHVVDMLKEKLREDEPSSSSSESWTEVTTTAVTVEEEEKKSESN